jgi:hypothetical protein
MERIVRVASFFPAHRAWYALSAISPATLPAIAWRRSVYSAKEMYGHGKQT